MIYDLNMEEHQRDIHVLAGLRACINHQGVISPSVAVGHTIYVFQYTTTQHPSFHSSHIIHGLAACVTSGIQNEATVPTW